MAEPILAIRGLRAGYPGNTVLKGLDLAVPEGRITAIVGPNGHGKSTLLRAVSGLVRIEAGEISLRGKRIDGRRPDQIVEDGVIQLPQGDLLFPSMTVLENLLMGAYRKAAAVELDARLATVFDVFPKLKERSGQVAGTLSGGERRMCGIGRGLMAGGDVLMLDEPSLGLAPIVIDQIYEVIFDLRRRGQTILLVEENAQRIAEHADMIHLLDNGRFAWTGPGPDLLARPEILETYLGA
jgi:branched-chain amino acid transport system ATP-binding protein